jgi:hypothetical protein
MSAYDLSGRGRPSTGVVLGVFLYLWGALAFLCGAVLVSAPVDRIRGLVSWTGSIASSGAEVRWGLIVLVLGGTLLASRWLVRRMFTSESRRILFGIPAVATIAVLAPLWSLTSSEQVEREIAGGGSPGVTLETPAQLPSKAPVVQGLREAAEARAGRSKRAPERDTEMGLPAL